ncbi:MAG TPA: UDP-2,4-diacetamido-2,4,6-trideoxy-beta-L-altropyranose hydrolase [Stellaceae bacterium]|nr:UDP-2,4-diacetamido-2,4,6-trideoxy-beta-L-altropyranose hydrolase [Stellaceae bacterium]
MTDKQVAIFRADASVTIGGGHVRRCLVLADALVEAGWAISFVSGAAARDIVPALARSGLAVIEPAAFEKAPTRCDLLVVDDYRLDAAFERTARAWAKRILVIDDLANRPHACDVVLDQSPGRERNAYAALVPEDCELLLGPSYALLDGRFRAARRQRKAIGKIERIFVNFGTTDTANATSLALDAVAAARLGAVVDIVIGGAAPHAAALQAKVAAMPDAVLHVDVDDVAALMRIADLAIGAGGVGALERCALGLPSAILTVADNQHTNAQALAASGAAVYWGDAGTRGIDEIATALKQLAGDQAVRAAMSNAAAALVDGFGAARARMSCDTPLRAKDGRLVSLRPASFADSAAMFAWQSAPGARIYARDPAAPKQGEHERWLKAKLADPDCIFNIVLCGDEPVGILRFDRLARPNSGRDALEVSILIAVERQGLGIAGAALALGKRLLPKERVVAAIHAENRASVRLFEAAGYRAAGEGEWILEPATSA